MWKPLKPKTMNKPWVLLFLTLAYVPLWGQSLERKLFSSGGGNGAQGLFTFSMSFGEPVIGTDQSSIPYLTRGFHQPIPLILLQETILGDLIFREVGSSLRFQWFTEMNYGAAYFEVEYGEIDEAFSVLETIPAQGFADTLQAYQMLHSRPQKGYYRVRLQLLDGSSRWTRTQFWQPGQERLWSLFFIPEQSSLLLSGANPDGGPVQVSLWNLAGQQLWTLSRQPSGNPIELPLHSVAEGLYLLRIQQDGRGSSLRFRQLNP